MGVDIMHKITKVFCRKVSIPFTRETRNVGAEALQIHSDMKTNSSGFHTGERYSSPSQGLATDSNK